MQNHNTVDCFKKPKGQGNGSNNKGAQGQKRKHRGQADGEQLNAIITKSVQAAMKEYQKQSKSDSSDDELNNLNDIDSYSFPTSTTRKKRKKAVYVPQTIGTIASLAYANPTALRVLIDSGCTSTIILKKYAKQFHTVVEPKTWKTEKGTFTTTHRAKVNFKLPEFCRMKEIAWPCYVNTHSNPKQASYDMIIGLD
ncbi:MAG: hypothetical protein ACREOZ_00520, partial [Gloeomargaritales cyanobacterium]